MAELQGAETLKLYEGRGVGEYLGMVLGTQLSQKGFVAPFHPNKDKRLACWPRVYILAVVFSPGLKQYLVHGKTSINIYEMSK